MGFGASFVNFDKTAEEKLKVVVAVIQDGKAVSHVADEVIAEIAKQKRLADKREKLHNADIKRKACWLEKQA